MQELFESDPRFQLLIQEKWKLSDQQVEVIASHPPDIVRIVCQSTGLSEPQAEASVADLILFGWGEGTEEIVQRHHRERLYETFLPGKPWTRPGPDEG